MKYSIKKYLMALAGLILTANTNAAIIDHGNYLTDTQTNTDWLDVTQSVNMSHNEVIAEMAPGGKFFGWRYASGTEFIKLISNAAILPLSSLSTYYALPNVTDNLITMLGSTLDTYYINSYSKTYDEYYSPSIYSQHYTQGLLSDEIPDQTGTAYFAALINDVDISGASLDDGVQAYSNGFGSDSKGFIFGSYLVRTSNTVAEPESVALVGLSLIALIATRRKKLPNQFGSCDQLEPGPIYRYCLP